MDDIKPNFTRVTTPLSVFSNFDKINPDILQKACDRGTLVHRYCELYIKGIYFPEPDSEINLYVESFKKWADNFIENFLNTELRLYDDNLMLTGMIDIIATIKGDLYPSIIDIKTGSAKSKSWPLQLSAYSYLLKENFKNFSDYSHLIGKDIELRRIVLQLNKNGKMANLVEYTDHKKDWELYKMALSLYKYFK